MPSRCKIVIPYADAKQMTVPEAIKIAMDKTRATNSEHLFTYATKTQLVTSAIVEGDCGGVGTPQYVHGDVGGGDYDATFHTHPKLSAPLYPAKTCGFSATDIITDFVDQRRIEAKVGCPDRHQVATVRLEVPPFVRPLVSVVRNEAEVKGLLEGMNSYNFLALLLAQALPQHKQVIETIRAEQFDKMPGERKAERMMRENYELSEEFLKQLPVRVEGE